MKAHVLQYLESSAESNPERCAVIDEFGSYSYGLLVEVSMRIGSGLARAGATGHGVIVSMDKSFEALAAQLGALYAGAFYVPVDPSVPAGRLESIVSVLDDPIVVYNGEAPESLQSVCSEESLVDFKTLEQGAVDYGILSSIREASLDTDPVYTLFTSGSTGMPKGVVISHRAIVSFVDSFVETFGITSSDRIGNQAPFDFDVSTKDIYSTFAASATLVIVPRRLFMQPVELAHYLSRHRVTVLIWAVAALCLISSYHALGEADLSSIRTVMFSGEVMPSKHLKAWRSALPQATFVNLYGPTEVTCNCLYHILDPQRDYEDGMPLGRPFAHCDVLLVGSDGNVVSESGVDGELLVRGLSLALGYLGEPELTARAFKQNPTNDRFPDRVYCTGDLAMFNDNGELVFRGRKDNQVKYQGHRIELEEVDLAFERLPGVNRCRCVFDEKRKRLLSFYEGPAEAGELLATARETLPVFMRPTSIQRVQGMPLNKNGKVDRACLLALASRPRRKGGK